MPFFRRVDHRAVAGDTRSRAAALFDMGRYAEAEALLREQIGQGSQDAVDLALSDPGEGRLCLLSLAKT